MANKTNVRRRFLGLLATSPILPLMQLLPWRQQAMAQESNPYFGLAPSVVKSLKRYDDSITTAERAIDVFDLQKVAQNKLSVGHNAYLEGGAEDQATERADREGFQRYELVPRRLVNIDKIDMSVKLFGKKGEAPIILCPLGNQRAFNVEGELPVARAAKMRKQIMALSTGASCSIEEVTAARGEPVWYQLYSNRNWSLTKAMIKRAESAGSTVMAFTVDAPTGYNRETLTKVVRQNAQFCEQCHTPNPDAGVNSDPWIIPTPPMRSTKPLGPPVIDKESPTWDYVKRLKDTTSMKLLVKGICAREDGELAMEYGADGVWISNHGGRVENSGLSTVECIQAMVAGVAGRGPVIVDSGFRRGEDIFKALALGATAVGIGQPYIWGLASFGQAGVERIIEILRNELHLIMRQMGATSIGAINKSFIIDRARY
jgi:isopentenyl diphosphate isomerase/L-lactate dehydrogenase-like FMN-dependent dehydrogenase